MNEEAFKTKCPWCGKDVYAYSPRRSRFCSKMCEANYKYKRKFDSEPEENRPTWEEVQKFGVDKFED